MSAAVGLVNGGMSADATANPNIATKSPTSQLPQATSQNPSPQLDQAKMLRGRLTEIFASTANDCLTELGYQPEVWKKLAQMDQWRTENAKLFADNQTVLRALQDKREQLMHLSGLEAEKSQRVAELEQQVFLLTTENHELKKETERLTHALIADPNIQPLFQQYQRLNGQYQAALREIQMLKSQLSVARSPQTAVASPPAPSPYATAVPPSGVFIQEHHVRASAQSPPRTAPPDVNHSSAQPPHQQLRRASDSTLQQKADKPQPQPFPETFAFRRSPSANATVTPPINGTIEPVHDGQQHHTLGKLAAFASPFQTSPAIPASPTQILHSPQQLPPTISPLKAAPASFSTSSDQTSQQPAIQAANESTSSEVNTDRTAATHQTTNPATKEPESLKRTSSEVSSHEPEHKKSRLEVSTDTPATPPQDTAANDVAEESDDEPVRVGPDGLRLVEDCLVEVISDGQDGAEAGTCILCNARYEQNLLDEKPKAFQNMTQDEIEQHFTALHSSAWDAIRRDVA